MIYKIYSCNIVSAVDQAVLRVVRGKSYKIEFISSPFKS